MVYRRIIASVALAWAFAGSAQAATVADSLPYGGTEDWSDHQYYGSMSSGGSTTVLTTTPYGGVWFGWHLGVNPPAWAPGSSSEGNYLSLTAAFSADAADWNTYFYDGAYTAEFIFNPTGCDDACYSTPAADGVSLRFASGLTFLSLDTTQSHTYELLLKDGQVSYRIDGVAYTAGAKASTDDRVLIIGDGSGGTGTGLGSMTISAVSFDNAPELDVLVTTAPVPEPGEWAMLVAGLGIVGAAARRRKG